MTRYSVDVDALVGREPFAWVSHSLVNHVIDYVYKTAAYYYRDLLYSSNRIR
ncbi:hypothetical protein COCMIDRAFT_111511 [Bipolaris oryzae ATCC 44560]|uniref:Uncharacterized protein n=1 Tax=Bipolaris oryzae ATCC 44560 TaxID=930090 RepID=W6YVC5_COCMI|nr:uncharacterized protein COCMIDRAFT_111511 [Bipolaris oryzae ATCC 44560]EUC39464.1 hypothetical protein COCMIDRAFT_111511 [Bipolaris oryzae ATCC 44560]